MNIIIIIKVHNKIIISINIYIYNINRLFFNEFSQFFLTSIFASILLAGLFKSLFSYIIDDKFFSFTFFSIKFVVFKKELQ